MIVEAPVNLIDWMDPQNMNVQKDTYLAGDAFDPSNPEIPMNTKATFYVDQAKKNDELDSILDHPDPLGRKIKVRRPANGLFSQWPNESTIYVLNISLLRLLSQGGQLGRISGDKKFEIEVRGGSDPQKLKEDILEEFYKVKNEST